MVKLANSIEELLAENMTNMSQMYRAYIRSDGVTRIENGKIYMDVGEFDGEFSHQVKEGWYFIAYFTDDKKEVFTEYNGNIVKVLYVSEDREQAILQIILEE